MKIDFNTLITFIGVAMSCVIFIYYTNSVLIYRHSRMQSNILIICGYIILGIVSCFNNPTANIIAFIAVNFILLYIGFKESVRLAALRDLILLGMMMFGELILSLATGTKVEPSQSTIFSVSEDIIYVLFSKLIYFIETALLRRKSISRDQPYKSNEMFLFLLLPLSTCAYIFLFNHVSLDITPYFKVMFMIVGILLILSNILVYIVCDKIIDKNIKIQELQNIEHKTDIDYKSYELLKNNYDELKIMVHDFNKYCNYIEGLMEENEYKNKTDILDITQDFKNKNKEFLLVEYTNNKAFNVLLSQKMKECNQKNIDFQINTENLDLSFIRDKDVVAIFANLIDNAIESCFLSKHKKIFLNIYDMNKSYLVIRLDNSSDKTPETKEDGRLITNKNKNEHGIGMASIKKSLKNYNGKMKWEYSNENHTFTTLILMNYTNK